jgi:hypothetical protein
MAQVRWVPKLAEIDGFIEGLPASHGTYVGERGIRLNGGQRQRSLLHRAVDEAPKPLGPLHRWNCYNSRQIFCEGLGNHDRHHCPRA